MISLGELCAALAGDLEPTGPLLATRSLTGVHVSELDDPTTYLDGGELLLTTGIPLRGTDAAIGEYVGRLKAKGVLALGLGLGPLLDEVPPALERACRQRRLDLLVVPPRAGFQRVSRAYWSLSERDGHADLVSSIGVQTALTRAATRVDAISTVVRGLAQALGGWAAFLPSDGARTTCWPDNAQPLMAPLRTATRDLHREGTLSPRTFSLLGHAVVEYPIASDGRVHGFLAVSPGRALTPANRQVIATVCMLLAIKAHQRELVAGAAGALAGGVAKLLARGHAEAARVLAADAGLPEVPERVRVLALAGSSAPSGADAAGLLRAARWLERDPGLPPLPREPGHAPLCFAEEHLAFVILPEPPAQPPGHLATAAGGQGGTAAGGQGAAAAGGGVAGYGGPPPGTGATAPSRGDREEARAAGNLRAVIGPAVAVAGIPGVLPALRSALARARPGRLTDGEHTRGDTRAGEWVERLAAYPRADLLPTVREYLRHLGRWEDAARVLGVHRNTLRHRVGVAERLLGVTLTDPDVLAPLWLALATGDPS